MNNENKNTSNGSEEPRFHCSPEQVADLAALNTIVTKNTKTIRFGFDMTKVFSKFDLHKTTVVFSKASAAALLKTVGEMAGLDEETRARLESDDVVTGLMAHPAITSQLALVLGEKIFDEEKVDVYAD